MYSPFLLFDRTENMTVSLLVFVTLSIFDICDRVRVINC